MDEDFGDLSTLFLAEPEIDDGSDTDVLPAEESAPPPGGGPTCETCGDTIPWAGRGRKPKFCVNHKTRTAGARKATSRALPSVKIREELVGDLTREIAFFGTGLSKVMPTTGVTTFKRAEQTAKALVKIAGDNPRLLGVLELSAKAISVVDLGEAGASIGVALMVDLGRMQPDAAISQMLGVSETWHELNDEGPDPSAAASYQAEQATEARLQNSVFAVAVPPRFETIQ